MVTSNITEATPPPRSSTGFDHRPPGRARRLRTAGSSGRYCRPI
jgi:hypothetical protein